MYDFAFRSPQADSSPFLGLEIAMLGGISIKRLFGGTRTGKWIMASAAAVAFAAPTLAHADDLRARDNDRRPEFHDQDRDHDRDRDGGRVNVDIRVGERAPRYEQRETRVWIPATYKTVCEQQWVEATYRTECERAWIPNQYENREVRFRDHGKWCTRVERVLVVPGHYENRDLQVLVTAGHFVNVDRQVCVTEGHYETRVDRVVVRNDRLTPFDVVNPMLRGLGVHIGR